MSADQKAASSTDYQVVLQLMKRMGSKRGFTPVPPSQHQWQRMKGLPELIRVWSWAVENTLAWGKRCEYAISVDRAGTIRPLTIEDIADDLGMDAANVYRAWRQGVELGLWRNGTKAEGPRKLYLRGDVPPPPTEDGEERAKETVCTDILPPSVLKQAAKCTPEQQQWLRQSFANIEEAGETARADYAAVTRAGEAKAKEEACRMVNILFQRQEHKSNLLTPEEIAARDERRKAIAEPAERYVQTVLQSVQTRNSAVYEAEKTNAQTATTLLPERTTREEPERAGGVFSREPRARPETPLPNDGKKSLNQLPARSLPELSGEEREAEDLAFVSLRQAQEAYPHTKFSAEPISRERTCDVMTIRTIVRIVSPGYMAAFLSYVREKFEGLDHNALGAAPARSPRHPHGPRSLGLIVTWAEDFARQFAEAAKQEVWQAMPTGLARYREIECCQQILANPKESAHMKDMARELIATITGAETKGATS